MDIKSRDPSYRVLKWLSRWLQSKEIAFTKTRDLVPAEAGTSLAIKVG